MAEQEELRRKHLSAKVRSWKKGTNLLTKLKTQDPKDTKRLLIKACARDFEKTAKIKGFSRREAPVKRMEKCRGGSQEQGTCCEREVKGMEEEDEQGRHRIIKGSNNMIEVCLGKRRWKDGMESERGMPCAKRKENSEKEEGWKRKQIPRLLNLFSCKFQ